MNDGLIVHCPRCGAALHVQPDVDQASFHSDVMRITFRFVDVTHRCKDGAR